MAKLKNLESKLKNMQEESKHLKDEMKALQESIEFQNGSYEKMKKDSTEEKQKLETDYKTNKEVQNLIQQNTKMKKQITELDNRHRKNNLRFTGIKKKSGVESETLEETEIKVTVFMQEKLGLETG